MKKFDLKNISVVFIWYALSAVCLTFIQVPWRGHVLAWVALVPFVIVSLSDVATWRLVWVSYLVSACYWLGNLYWIGYVTVPAYVILGLYLGLYWPLMVFGLRFLRRKRVPLVLAVVMVVGGAEAWQGILITGFSWRLLAHSQYANLPLIQICDIFGAMAVTIVIAAVNGLIAQIIIDWRKGKMGAALSSANVLGIVVVAVMVVGAVIYGNWRLGQGGEFIEEGPVIGSVQPNVSPASKEMSEMGDVLLADLIDQSDMCMKAGAIFVAWPETMVLSSLNKSYMDICMEGTRPKIFDGMIREHTKDNGYVLVGAHSAELVVKDGDYEIADRYNSAFLYRPDGMQDEKRYDKIHLVPFGEYIPFKNSAPFIYKFIMKFSPYDYDYNLTRGTEYTAFEVVDGADVWHFGVLICYEDTDAEVTRKMVVDSDGRKKIDWIANISNDGWYTRYSDEGSYPSGELSQRLAITVFRAIENRISVLRSVNSGISCIIDTTGAIRDGFMAGSLPEAAMEREAVSGWFVDRINTDGRITFFSQHGKWVDTICAWEIIVVLVLAGIGGAQKRKLKG